MKLALRNVTIAVAATWIVIQIATLGASSFGYDAHAYWAVWRIGPYTAAPMQKDAFLYSPAIAQAFWLPGKLPWPVFVGIWTAVNCAIFAWLLAPLGWRKGALAFLFCVPGIIVGNVWAFLALGLVLGLRHASAWAFPLLAKITPAVGIPWFLARREWRRAGVAVGAGVTIAAVSFAADPHLWGEWTRSLLHPHAAAGRAGNTTYRVPLGPRLAVAISLTVWAARRNRPGWLPLASALATPVFAPLSLTVLAAIPRVGRPPQPNCAMKRRSFSHRRRMSGMSWRRPATRSTPSPNANPVCSSGS